MAIAPSELRTVGEGDAMCATTGNAFRGVSMLIVRIASVMGYCSMSGIPPSRVSLVMTSQHTGRLAVTGAVPAVLPAALCQPIPMRMVHDTPLRHTAPISI
eukprot:scaffold17420_cov39-Attheya_sp.AAC.2